VNLTLVLCECHIGKQLPLQVLTQLIRIKLLISRITETFASYPNFQGGEMPVLPPPADAYALEQASPTARTNPMVMRKPPSARNVFRISLG